MKLIASRVWQRSVTHLWPEPTAKEPKVFLEDIEGCLVACFYFGQQATHILVGHPEAAVGLNDFPKCIRRAPMDRDDPWLLASLVAERFEEDDSRPIKLDCLG